MADPRSDLAGLVEAWRAGDAAALDRLMEVVYPDLRQIAHSHLQRERGDHTLGTTALVHEAYLKLVGGEAPVWEGRARFLGLLSRVMRHVLVDYARRRGSAKRGGDRIRVTLRPEDAVYSEDFVDLVALDEALEQLAENDERLARVVECRFFGGLEEADIATALGVSRRTVIRDWLRARAYLFRMLSPGGSDA